MANWQEMTIEERQEWLAPRRGHQIEIRTHPQETVYQVVRIPINEESFQRGIYVNGSWIEWDVLYEAQDVALSPEVTRHPAHAEIDSLYWLCEDMRDGSEEYVNIDKGRLFSQMIDTMKALDYTLTDVFHSWDGQA